MLADVRPEAVLHFAAKSLVGESQESPELYWENNVGGTLALLEAMRAADCRRIVFSSTAATYGEPDEVPIPEDAPTRPTNTYGASKLAVDAMLTSYAVAYCFAAVSLRYFNVGGAAYGRGERHATETHLIPIALQVAAGHPRGADRLRPGLPDARRHLHPRLRAREGPRRGAPAGAAGPRPGRAPDLQPGQRHRLLGAGDGRRRPHGDRAPDAGGRRPRRAGDPARLVASCAASTPTWAGRRSTPTSPRSSPTPGLRRSAALSRSAGGGVSAGASAGPPSGWGAALTEIRAIRRPSSSSTVSVRPSTVTVSPTTGSRPSSAST